jgi:hypothetical protein
MTKTNADCLRLLPDRRFGSFHRLRDFHYRRLHLRMGFELPSLAFKAMAHGDTNRIALACEPKVSAAACGFVVCHSSCPLP